MQCPNTTSVRMSRAYLEPCQHCCQLRSSQTSSTNITINLPDKFSSNGMLFTQYDKKVSIYCPQF